MTKTWADRVWSLVQLAAGVAGGGVCVHVALGTSGTSHPCPNQPAAPRAAYRTAEPASWRPSPASRPAAPCPSSAPRPEPLQGCGSGR
jgi:hypothetical protein